MKILSNDLLIENLGRLGKNILFLDRYIQESLLVSWLLLISHRDILTISWYFDTFSSTFKFSSQFLDTKFGLELQSWKNGWRSKVTGRNFVRTMRDMNREEREKKKEEREKKKEEGECPWPSDFDFMNESVLIIYIFLVTLIQWIFFGE